MKKNEINTKFRKYAQKLSPTPLEQALLSKIYESFNKLLGVNNCIQIGSYPRHTAITPVHDLDILYFLGQWNENNHSPAVALQNLYKQIIDGYENPTNFQINVDLQTHSVTIAFTDGDKEKLSVDIVPAFTYSKNEFGQDTYKVPEVIKKKHGYRKEYYQKLSEEHKDMDWIVSDPRGYIKVATETDKTSEGEFRKAVKIVKLWKTNLSTQDQNLKLKSFHVEQVITKYFQENTNLELADVIFKFFIDLPSILEAPNKIADRANANKFIDDYLVDFTQNQKEKIKEARDHLLIQLEKHTNTYPIEEIFNIEFYKRNSEEEFLFDSGIPVYSDEELNFNIDGFLRKKNGFREYNYQISSNGGKVDKKNAIKFRIVLNTTAAHQYKWKVKNDNKSSQPRGEITDGQTKNDPESTAYVGNHYVECFAIIDNTCVARSKQDVIIE